MVLATVVATIISFTTPTFPTQKYPGPLFCSVITNPGHSSIENLGSLGFKCTVAYNTEISPADADCGERLVSRERTSTIINGVTTQVSTTTIELLPIAQPELGYTACTVKVAPINKAIVKTARPIKPKKITKKPTQRTVKK